MRFKISQNTDSMCDTPEQLVEMMSHIQYQDFTKLMSPLEVFLTASGSCHDQVMLEMQELYNMGLKPIGKFIMSVDEFGEGEETHSFVYYKIGKRWYWFENAWEEFAGIHEYSNEQELIDSVMFAFGRRNGFVNLYIADFNPADHTIGEDLDTLVDICMNSAELYEVN